MIEILILCGLAFVAGLIDAVVGGGGLIQLPALLIMLPHTAIASILGTSKFVSIAGTSIAVQQYAKQQKIEWGTTIPAMFAAFIFSFLGARITSLLNPSLMRPVILVLLIAVAIYTFNKKDFGLLQISKFSQSQQWLYSVVIGSAIGFYDGFFGPGTGSFLIFAFVGIFGYSFLTASASAKIINFATNLAAILYFFFTNNIIYTFGIPMAICNILGAFIGTKLAISKGSQFVRKLFLVIVSLLICKLGYDIIK
ncbi:sulfite exporter TauE/SafE family protein [Pseudanabaena sp. UWO310]|uniref:sulfite exporter TauE/SafE family protein n=1 Tax=Pseudanabaena sp. UWO310 TaxID=2480795 RepID=UPI001158447B|nr:TSUP family transporter [Pseudanabaena sp. UWO310]TYQ25916.1 TSUP family transporter [Pseudanabaena sp. UWO310]